jgi:hypothetical protein
MGRASLAREATMQDICLRICVRKTFQNLLKRARIGRNKKNGSDVVSNTFLILKRLRSSRVLSTNP